MEIDGALHGVNGAGELDQHTVASGLKYAALMSGDQGAQHVTAPSFQSRQSGGFINFHKPAIADHISGQNGCKAALGAFFGHEDVIALGAPTGQDCMSDP